MSSSSPDIFSPYGFGLEKDNEDEDQNADEGFFYEIKQTSSTDATGPEEEDLSKSLAQLQLDDNKQPILISKTIHGSGIPLDSGKIIRGETDDPNRRIELHPTSGVQHERRKTPKSRTTAAMPPLQSSRLDSPAVPRSTQDNESFMNGYDLSEILFSNTSSVSSSFHPYETNVLDTPSMLDGISSVSSSFHPYETNIFEMSPKLPDCLTGPVVEDFFARLTGSPDGVQSPGSRSSSENPQPPTPSVFTAVILTQSMLTNNSPDQQSSISEPMVSARGSQCKAEAKRPRGRPRRTRYEPAHGQPKDILPKTLHGANLQRVEAEKKVLGQLKVDQLVETYDNGETRLHRYAADPGLTDRLRALLQIILHRLLQLPNQTFSEFVDKRDANGCTALLRAVSANQLESVVVLMEIMPNVELLGNPTNLPPCQTPNGSPRPQALSAVHLATASPQMLGLVLKCLHTHSPATQYRILEKRDEPYGRTPLLYAIEQNHPVDSIILLLQKGANPCAKYIRDGNHLDGLALTIVYHSNPLTILQSAMEVLVRDRPNHIPSLDSVINQFYDLSNCPVTLLDLAQGRQPVQPELANFVRSKGGQRFDEVDAANWESLGYILGDFNN